MILFKPGMSHRNNKDKRTMDQELPDTAADVLGRHFVCTHQTAALLNMKLRHVHHIENVMSNGKPRLCQSMRIYTKNTPAKVQS